MRSVRGVRNSLVLHEHVAHHVLHPTVVSTSTEVAIVDVNHLGFRGAELATNSRDSLTHLLVHLILRHLVSG